MTTAVACVGAGLIGRAFAVVFARGGARVTLWDSAPDGVAKALAWLGPTLADMRAAGLIDDPAALRARIAAAPTLDSCVARVQAIRDAAAAIRGEDVLVLCHGGPIAEPDDAAFILRETRGIAGFFGASSMERLPVERAITDQVRRFKQI